MALSHRVQEFNVWTPGYGGAQIEVLIGGTTSLAAVFSDPALTVAYNNPITLLTLVDNGISYGRLPSPIYVGVPYQIRVVGGENTGIQRLPLYSLAGVDASYATVRSIRGTVDRPLRAWADDEVYVGAFGTLGNGASANTVILNAAIGAAAAQGGGVVHVPAGNFPFTTLTLPAGVILKGEGRGITTLRSTETQAVVTIGGNRAGMQDLTLDGVDLNVGSIGVLSVGKNELLLTRVEIKRFEQGARLYGGNRHQFQDVDFFNNTRGLNLRGDTFSASGGTSLLGCVWQGGTASAHTEYAVRAEYVDAMVVGVSIENVWFTENTGIAVDVEGARHVSLSGGRFVNNVVNIKIHDDTDTSAVAFNTVRQFYADNVIFSAGEIRFDGECEDVQFRGCDFQDIDFILSLPERPVLLLDCTEDAQTTSTGATGLLIRQNSQSKQQVVGVTTDGVATTAWQMELQPGEVVRFRVRALGNQRNGLDWASYEKIVSARRDHATLSFDFASATLTAGTIMVGQISGAVARITTVTQSGASGSVTVRQVSGTFTVGEVFNTSDGKSATVTVGLNNPVVVANVAWQGDIGAQVETDASWELTVDALGSLVRARVKGAANKTVEWLVEVDMVKF
jgi:hypothetical protein